jgi:hypothetical protein
MGGKKTIKKKKSKSIKNVFNQKHCSPSKSDKTISCLDDDLLIKIANILNKYHDSNIKSDNKQSLHKQSLHKQISDKISSISDCKIEKCWTTINEIIKHLSSEELKKFKNSFRPSMPKSWKKDPTEWTSTSDIEKVLKQYEECNSNFKCYGALPMDFSLKDGDSCVSGNLCNIDLKEHFDSGKHNIGTVFNLDDHDEPGSHWVSMYIELVPRNRDVPSIYYFDSIADKPPKEIKEFVDNISEQYKKIKGEEIEFLYNDIQHQKRDTECGIYCIHFITTMLKGIDFNEYIKEIKNDDYMNKYRDFFYVRE